PAGTTSMYINDFSIEAGETKQVSINLDNTTALSAFQLELYLPEGLTMALDSRGRLHCGVNTDRADDHTLTFKDRGNGQYNATYYSTNSYDIIGNSGEIAYFYVTAADNFSGTATVSLKEIYVSDAAGNMTKLDDSSCTVTVTNSTIKATSISLDKTTATLTTGETTTLTATVLPGNATDKSVTWTSSNTAVATVDVNGKVTAVASGTATITVKTADGTNLTATCAVTVNALVEKATSIALDLTQFKTTETALVQVYPTIEPASAATQDVKWTSSNEEIATVDVHGRIKALKAGKVTIKATTTDGSDLSATCEVTIMLKGDMNDDFTIDVADMNSIINIILGL
ncbi:MAG: Ig domain-containing protein, partial [Bacteroidales bacterium]|nr:Ig domain-containing protein [Candidatus Sodaliphilus fimicaballi]